MPLAPVIADSRFTASQVGQWVSPGSGLTMFDLNYGINGTFTSSPTHTIDDRGSPAIQFNGLNHIDMGDNDRHDMHTSDWSVTCKFRYLATAVNFPQLVNKYGGAHGYGMEIVDDGGADDGKIRCWIKDASTRTNALSGTATAKDGAWHNVAAVWDRDGNLTVYLDGVAGTAVSISSYSATDIVNAFKLRFAAGDDGGGSPSNLFSGMIRDVRIYNRVLSGAEVVALTQTDMQTPRLLRPRRGILLGSTTLLTNLRVYYKFDDDGVDAHNGWNLTANNSPTYEAGALNNGTKLASASSQYFNEAGGHDLEAKVSGFSISAWIKPTTLAEWNAIASYRNGDKAGQFMFRSTLAGRISFIRWSDYNTNVDYSTNTGLIAAGTMYHVVATFTGTTCVIYINGSSVSVGSGTASNSWGNVRQLEVGRVYTGSSNHANSLIDEFGIWGRTLTASEVTSLYNSGTPKAYSTFGNTLVLPALLEGDAMRCGFQPMGGGL